METEVNLTNRKLKGVHCYESYRTIWKRNYSVFWIEHEESASVCLNVGEYLQEIFDTRADEGFEGNGYDWGSLAQVFLDEQCLDLQEKICFDPEGSMFCVYSKDKNALADFVLRFKKACEDKSFILDLFSRAELD